MKPILYWTFFRGRFGRTSVPFGVTSEGPRGRINGRFEDGYPSHTTSRDIVGKYDTLDAIKAQAAAVKECTERYEALRIPHAEAMNRLYSEESAELKRIMENGK